MSDVPAPQPVVKNSDDNKPVWKKPVLKKEPIKNTANGGFVGDDGIFGAS